MNAYKKMMRAVSDAYTPDGRVGDAIYEGNMNLYFGPNASDMSFDKAIEICREYADELPGELYYDVQTDMVFESAPEPEWDDEFKEWIEPVMHDWVELGAQDIRRAVFGELAKYL